MGLAVDVVAVSERRTRACDGVQAGILLEEQQQQQQTDVNVVLRSEFVVHKEVGLQTAESCPVGHS